MGCAESNMRQEEVESALAKEEDEEMSWIQRLLKDCSNRSTRRQNVAAAISSELPQKPNAKTVVLEVCIAHSAFVIFFHFSAFFLFFSLSFSVLYILSSVSLSSFV